MFSSPLFFSALRDTPVGKADTHTHNVLVSPTPCRYNDVKVDFLRVPSGVLETLMLCTLVFVASIFAMDAISPAGKQLIGVIAVSLASAMLFLPTVAKIVRVIRNLLRQSQTRSTVSSTMSLYSNMDDDTDDTQKPAKDEDSTVVEEEEEEEEEEEDELPLLR